MRSILLRVALGVVALTAACSADAVSPKVAASARRTVVSEDGTTITRQVDQNVWVSCLNSGVGEAVRITGTLRYDVHSMQDANGVYHLNIKSNTADLTGVGLTTGTFFRGSLSEHITSRAEDYLNENNRSSDIIRFVAPGSGSAYALMVTSHFIVDQGTYVLWDETWNEVCR